MNLVAPLSDEEILLLRRLLTNGTFRLPAGHGLVDAKIAGSDHPIERFLIEFNWTRKKLSELLEIDPGTLWRLSKLEPQEVPPVYHLAMRALTHEVRAKLAGVEATSSY